jgi:hypothetical protein
VIAGVLIGLLAVAAWRFRDPLYFAYLATRITPTAPFAAADLPPAPDYARDDAWAALPGRDDPADENAPGLPPAPRDPRAAAFFVHPTTDVESRKWNSDLRDAATNALTDDFSMRTQASVFDGCCAVYAPRYRQATLGSFYVPEDGARALAVAYRDVERAFDAFLARIGPGTPFLLAGHSQGARHVLTLLERRISGTPLQSRLVAAYPVGFAVKRTEIAEKAADVPVCASARETGCLVSWQSGGPDWQPYLDESDAVCVNPLSWRQDSELVSHEENPGTLSLSEGRIVPAVADARCIDGVLRVSEIRSDALGNAPFYLGQDNHHLFDFALFYASVRRNAAERADAFDASKRNSSATDDGRADDLSGLEDGG